MTAVVNVVSARTMGRSFATDPDLQLPVRPCFISELLVCPFEEDGVLFVGTQSTEVIRGRSARLLLPRLLPLLDGTRTQEDLYAMLPELSAENLRDVLSLLFSRGLMEDGRAANPERPDLAEVASFLGRYNDVARRNRNRADAMAHIAASCVRVHGPAKLVECIVHQLAEAGVSNVRDEFANFGIVISTGDEPSSLETIEACLATSETTLLVRLGEREAHIGPRLARGVSLCPACLARMHPHPAGNPSPLLAELWLGLAGQRAFLELSRITPSVNHHTFDEVSVNGDGIMMQRKRLAPRMPGCEACGLKGDSWAFDDPRLLSWFYHQATSVSRRRDLAPRDHQVHYLVSNLKLGATRQPPVHSSSTCCLPPPAPLDVPVPWARRSPPGLARRFGINDLSTLMAKIAGETGEGVGRRRIAPTGGNLGSVRLWVLARDVDGLGRGAYLYDPHEHALGLRAGFDDSELSDALGTKAELPPCVVLGTGDLAKCTQKYQGFAYRLIHFDAGIAVAFAHVVADGLGLLLREYPDFDIQLPQIFRVARRWDFALPTFAMGVYIGAIPKEPFFGTIALTERPEIRLTPEDYVSDLVPRMLAAGFDRPAPTPWPLASSTTMAAAVQPRLERLEQVLQRRRAVRKYSRMPPPRELLEAVITVASAICANREAAGAAPGLVRPVLTVSNDSPELLSGIYEFNSGLPSRIVRRAAFDGVQARECVNQLGLARSPASLVLVGDLHTALVRRSARGYDEVAVAAGAAVGMAWLAACSYGLVGTAAGGVIAHGFREAATMDGFNECPLLALYFGLPAVL